MKFARLLQLFLLAVILSVCLGVLLRLHAENISCTKKNGMFVKTLFFYECIEEKKCAE